MTPEEIRKILKFQANEITEHHIYGKLAVLQKSEHNQQILKELSAEELKHYNLLKKYTNRDPKPHLFRIWFYVWLARLFGLTFSLKWACPKPNRSTTASCIGKNLNRWSAALLSRCKTISRFVFAAA